MNYRIAVVLTVVAQVGGCNGGVAPPPPIDTTDTYIFSEEYRIGVGDSLAVNVYGHPDVSATVTVRPDGKITLPIAGDVSVGGEVPSNVASSVAKTLETYIRNPIVTVTVASISGSDYLSRIRITGAVNNPQSVDFRNGMTVMDVVLEAGGVSEFANPSRTKLYRAGLEPYAIRLDRILKGRDLSTNIRLQPGDVISVPERTF